ncbi:hypothetical protein [Chitinivorax sp. B]|uniref:hypothetical protein n=1 Tax=Chitinivorax sp. B TaxID=2502235 RepID=UPI0010F65AD2|nr:hypothetical protein [Chitinivorax sp. B]
MNHDFLIRTTNRLAIYSIFVLLYWVFVFMLITIFDLKIFRERTTESFFISLLGIFAMLGGAVVLNVMSNLSKISAAIADKPGQAPVIQVGSRRQWLWVALSFPILAAALLGGDALSAQHKKNLLIHAAEKLIEENRNELATLAHYEFTQAYIDKADDVLGTIQRIDSNLPQVTLIMPDEIAGKRVFLSFGDKSYASESNKKPEKKRFIEPRTKDERDYLMAVFNHQYDGVRFEAERGNYRLYFPTTIANKRVVMYFTDYQQYGKLGS